MLAPLGLDHAYPANGARSGRASPPASRVSDAVKFCSAQVAALLYGSRDARQGRALSAFRKAKPAVTAIANERKIIWVRPDDIIYKIRGDHDLHANDILAGDWDLDRALLVDSIKYQSICKHFRDGVAWEDTELFGDYAARFRRGEIVRGTQSLARLKRQYDTRVEAVFRDLRRNRVQDRPRPLGPAHQSSACSHRPGRRDPLWHEGKSSAGDGQALVAQSHPLSRARPPRRLAEDARGGAGGRGSDQGRRAAPKCPRSVHRASGSRRSLFSEPVNLRRDA